jgi:hypothetical protein
MSVVVHAARLWRERGSDRKLKVTIVDLDTRGLEEVLNLRLPGLMESCDIETLSISVQSPQFHQAAFLFDKEERFTVTSVYICLDKDSLGLSAALALLHHLRRHRVPIVVRMNENAGLAALLAETQKSGQGFDNLHSFGLLERTCQPDLVLGGTNELLARAIHEQYLYDQQKAGHSSKDNPALVSWERLPEDIKESNRKQADHIGLKLQSIGCDIAPLTEWNAQSFVFSPEEVEKMARLEHERWVAERCSQGWTYGPRDPEKKTNPNLVEWDNLSEESKQFNRDVILGLPEALTRAGLQVYRFDTV